MSYETGTASNQNDLLDKLYTFLTGVSGWTGQMNAAAPDDGSDLQVAFSHVPVATTWYYTLVSRNGLSPERIEIGASTGFSSGSDIYSQTGTFATNNSTAGKAMIPFSGSLTYYFFATATYCYVAMRVGDYFQYLGFGEATLQGGYTNGIFALATKTSTSYDYDSASGQQPLGAHYHTTDGGQGSGRFRDHGGSWITFNRILTSYASACVTNQQSSIAANQTHPNLAIYSTGNLKYHSLSIAHTLVPTLIYAPHPSIAGKSTFAGYLPDVYVTGADNLTLPAEIIIGSDTYSIFPIWQVGDGETSFAFKQTP